MKIMLRLFTCIWVPEKIKREILNFQEKLKKLPIKAKFVEGNNLHITVTFLGNIYERDLDQLKKKLDVCVKDVKSFHVKLGGIKLIPNENYIRVIGIKITDEERGLEGLIKNVGRSINGKYRESSKLTLCRVKNVLDKKALKEFIEKNYNVSFGSFHVNLVSLVKSTLTRSGPIYETIHESKLK